jgi:PAS domain S-box-containing protein
MKMLHGFINSPLVRYVVSICITIAALLLHQALVKLVGGNLPTYIFFYPAVIIAALFAGFRAGLLATGTAALLADYWIITPVRSFTISSLPDAIGLAIFVFNGVLISVIAELYRRTRTKAANYAAELALRESEEQYRNLFENANEAIIVAQDGKSAFFNQMTISLLGYSSEELSSKPFVDFIHPDDREKVYHAYLKRIEGKEIPFRHSYRVIRKDGNILWVERNAVLITWKGKPATLNFLSDITERKQAEEALTNSEAKLRKEQNFSQLLLDTSPALIVAIGFDGKTLMMNKALLDTLEYAAEEIKEADYLTTFVPEEDRGMLSDVFQKIIQKRIATVNENRIISKSGRTYLIEWHGRTVSHEVEGSGFFVGVGIDITSRKKMEEALRQSEDKYRTLLESIDNGYCEQDLAGTFTFLNDSMCRIYGYPKEELMGMNYKQYTDKESGKKCFQAYRNIYKTGEPGKVFDFEIIRKDGTKRHIESSVSLQKDSAGKRIAFRGIVRDITDRKQAAEALRESEEKYRSMIETIQDGYFEVDLAGKFTFVNDAQCRIVGTPREQLLGMSNMAYTSEEEAKRLYQLFSGIYKTGEPVKGFAFEYKKRDGTIAFNEISASLIRNSQGKPIGFRGIAREVTERKRAEEVLRQSEGKYRTIIETIQDGYFETDLTGKFTFVNDAECNNLGYTREELIEMAPAGYTGEKNRKLLTNLFIEIYKTGIPVKAYNLEFTKKDGTTAYNEISVSLISNSQGEPIGFRGIARDVTERKQADEERKQSFERMRKALGATVQAICMTVEMKDPYTSGHQRRVSDLARSIATEMGLSADRRDFIRTASSIHDIGKIAIPSEILSKPTKLTDLEFNLIKTHSQSGYDIMKDIEFPWPVADVVLQHHERMDGSGYPRNLKGDDILMEARIMAVADVVEAMASHRPYRPSKGI